MAVIGRRRRPRWLWPLILLTAVVVFVDLVVSNRSDAPTRRNAALGYLDQVRAQITQSNREGADLADVRVKAAALGRAGLTARLGRIADDSARTLASARAAEAPANLSDARSLLLATFVLRARAAAVLKDALNAALAPPAPPPSVLTKLVGVGADFNAADRTYTAFLDAINAQQGVGKDSLMPKSQWVEDPVSWQQPDLAAFLTALRNSTTVAPVHDTTIVLVTTDPSAVHDENGRSVLPLSKQLRVQIIVANVGNENEKDLKVEVTLVPGGAKTTARDFVTLAPGQRDSLSLGGFEPIAGPATLTVTIDAPPGESAATMADNTKVLQLLFR
jgi:hypothetical protein